MIVLTTRMTAMFRRLTLPANIDRSSVCTYTYAPISQLLYHLGPMAFTPSGNRDFLTLTDANSTRWQALTTPAVKQKLTIKIPGGKLADM